MAVPKRILEAILETSGGWIDGFGFLTSSIIACEGSKFHSPTPLTVHGYIVENDKLVQCDILNYKTGSTDLNDQIWYLCGTCFANCSILIELLKVNGGEMPWIVRREFGNLIRVIAYKAYDLIKANTDG